MKKIVFAFLVFFSFATISCTKEEIVLPESALVYTDDPPREMFDPSQYGQTYKAYLEKIEVEKAVKNGYFCEYDQNTGQSFNCNDYYTVPARRYWGLYKGKIYVSKGTSFFGISASILLNLQNAIKVKTAVIVYTCKQCQPFMNLELITGVE